MKSTKFTLIWASNLTRMKERDIKTAYETIPQIAPFIEANYKIKGDKNGIQKKSRKK